MVPGLPSAPLPRTRPCRVLFDEPSKEPVKQSNEATQPAGEGSQAESGKPEEAGYQAGENHAFDPMKELNLPANYDEVVTRFKRLQSNRAMESLN